MKRSTKVLTHLTVALIFATTVLGPGAVRPAGAGETASAGDTDWPHWAGPQRDGSAAATGIFQTPFELHEVWRRPIGGGISALVVAGGRVVSFDVNDDRNAAFALDAETGEELWRIDLGPSHPRQHEFGIATTPASDDRRVVFVGADCYLRGIEGATGKEKWNHDLRAEFATGALRNGCFTSPLIDGDRVIVQVNGEPDKRVVAFDLDTGELIWAAAGVKRAVRSSPSIGTLAGVRQVVVHDVSSRISGVYGLRATDGQLLWDVRFPKVGSADAFSYDMPFVAAGDHVILPIWSELLAAKVRREGDAFSVDIAWRTNQVRAGGVPVNLHAIAHGDHIYGFGGELLHCLEAATGRSIWQEKIYPGSLILVDGHLVVLGQATGIVRVVEAAPAGYREKLRQQVLTPGVPADTPPSFARGRLYLRNSDEIVVLEPRHRGAEARP